MATVEEWQADFEIPDGQGINGKDDEEDWDVEMELGKTGGAIVRRAVLTDDLDDDDDEDDEGVSTIKVSKLTENVENIEDDFALPPDVTTLSLAPLTLAHRTSKSSLEWTDKDHTSSSQSSDAYSSLGFADASPSSNPTSCPSTETDDDDEDEEDHLDGLVIPSDIFDSGQSGRKLTKILEMKKTTVTTDSRLKIVSPDPEDDFEIGLIIDDDVDFSPSRLIQGTSKEQARRMTSRMGKPAAQRLRPSKLKPDRAKSPVHPPPISSARQLQKLRLSPSPPLNPIPHSHSFQPLSSAPSTSPSFLAPKPASLRGQKSHTGLKPFTPPPELRRLPRKASLSSLIESSQSQAAGSGSGAQERPMKARYEEPTAASRAKSHKASLSRLDYKVPPTRPCTPSNNPAALRLTMPTQSRLKSRPTLSAVGWSPAITPSAPSPSFRTSSPLPVRPPSSSSTRLPSSAASAKVLKRPKRPRVFGDGSELDGIEDLPTDREKESRFRVQPKSYGNRIPGGSYFRSSGDKGTIRKKTKRNPSGTTSPPLIPPTQKTAKSESSSKKKKTSSTPRRKPMLIRNLGGVGATKVVGDMKWNPQALRWEGNEHVLREFDTVVTSTRPALITHLTGSSIGSPVGTFATGARIVGNMIFDPKRMCWLSTLPPEEDEPDVFANLADDEEEAEGWEARGGTIRASLQSSTANNSTSTAPSFIATSSETASPARSHLSVGSDHGSDRSSSRASVDPDVDDEFIQLCRKAEERHRVEMKGWRTAQDVFDEPNRAYLYEIRAVATRSYSIS